MDAKGLMLKQGTLIDAALIEAAPRKPRANEDGTGGRSPQDLDADWTKKGGKYHFGYKVHAGIDQGSELVRKISMTPAHVHDGNMLESALSGDENWAFADKAYDSKKNDKILKGKGISNGILIKGTCKRALTAVEKRCNRILSKLRSPIRLVS